MASIVAVAALSGCTGTVVSPAQTVSPSTGATSSAQSFAAVPAGLVLHGASLGVLDSSGKTITDVPFSAGKQAVLQELQQVAGPAPSHTFSSAGCADGSGNGYAPVEVTWGAAVGQDSALSYSDYGASPQDFSISFAAAKTSTGIALTVPGGVGVGDAAAKLVATVSGATMVDSAAANATYTWYDLAGSGDQRSGALAYGAIGGGTIQSIIAPEAYFDANASMEGDC